MQNYAKSYAKSGTFARLCRNTPSGWLVGAAPLGVASVYGHSPFGADSAPSGEHPHGVHDRPSHMLALPHTSPLEHVVLENKYANSVLAVGMQLDGLWKAP